MLLKHSMQIVSMEHDHQSKLFHQKCLTGLTADSDVFIMCTVVVKKAAMGALFQAGFGSKTVNLVK